MDNLNEIAIRFHFGEAFNNVDGSLLYVRGDIAESWIHEDMFFLDKKKPT